MTLATVVNRLFCQSVSSSHRRLKYFLNSVLKDRLSGAIKEIAYIQVRERPGINPYLETQLHIKARSISQEHLDIYLFVKHEAYSNQFQLYENSSHYNQTMLNTPFQLIKKTYYIKLANFNLLQEYTHYHNVYSYKDMDTHTQLHDADELHYLELPKFNSTHLDSPLQLWMALFKYVLQGLQLDTPLPLALSTDDIIKESYELISQSHNYEEAIEQSKTNRYGYDQKLLRLGKQSGEWSEKKKIIISMIKEGYNYQAILNVIDVTQEQLDQLVVDYYHCD